MAAPAHPVLAVAVPVALLVLGEGDGDGDELEAVGVWPLPVAVCVGCPVWRWASPGLRVSGVLEWPTAPSGAIHPAPPSVTAEQVHSNQ